MKTKTIKAEKLGVISMSVNKKLPQIVIDEGIVKEYVGIGWEEIGRASAFDREKYPTVVRGD